MKISLIAISSILFSYISCAEVNEVQKEEATTTFVDCHNKIGQMKNSSDIFPDNVTGKVKSKAEYQASIRQLEEYHNEKIKEYTRLLQQAEALVPKAGHTETTEEKDKRIKAERKVRDLLPEVRGACKRMTDGIFLDIAAAADLVEKNQKSPLRQRAHDIKENLKGRLNLSK